MMCRTSNLCMRNLQCVVSQVWLSHGGPRRRRGGITGYTGISRWDSRVWRGSGEYKHFLCIHHRLSLHVVGILLSLLAPRRHTASLPQRIDINQSIPTPSLLFIPIIVLQVLLPILPIFFLLFSLSSQLVIILFFLLSPSFPVYPFSSTLAYSEHSGIPDRQKIHERTQISESSACISKTLADIDPTSPIAGVTSYQGRLKIQGAYDTSLE